MALIELFVVSRIIPVWKRVAGAVERSAEEAGAHATAPALLAGLKKLPAVFDALNDTPDDPRRHPPTCLTSSTLGIKSCVDTNGAVG